jgi:hypothetical protein
VNSEELAAKKSLLLARSSFYRMTLAHEAALLRESLDWRRLARSATSQPARPFLLGALALLAGRKRIAGLVGLAARALMLIKVVRAVGQMVGRRRA